MNGGASPIPLDLVVAGGTLLTMNPAMEILENPVIGIRDGRIVFVRTGMTDIPEARERIDAAGCAVLPGLVNTHTHSPMVCFRGLADDAEAKYVNRDMVYAGTTLAMAEMLLSGTTTFCDSYFYGSSIAQAVVDGGMRAVVCQGFIDFPTPDSPDPSRQIEIAEKFVGTWRNRSPRVTPSLFCHTPCRSSRRRPAGSACRFRPTCPKHATRWTSSGNASDSLRWTIWTPSASLTQTPLPCTAIGWRKKS